MIRKVQKEPITDINSMKVGHMITRDYLKPTQKALTVIEVTKGHGKVVVWLEDGHGNEMKLNQIMLDNNIYDLQTVPRHSGL